MHPTAWIRLLVWDAQKSRYDPTTVSGSAVGGSAIRFVGLAWNALNSGSAGSGLSIPSSSASRATKVTPSGSLQDAYRTPRGCACSIAANIFLAEASTSSTLSALTVARIMITLIGSLLLLIPIPSGPGVIDTPDPCCHATCSRSSVVRAAATDSDLGTATATTMAKATTPVPAANARWYPSVNAAAAPCPAASRPLVRDVDTAASTARPREPPTWELVWSSPESRPESLDVAPDMPSVMVPGNVRPSRPRTAPWRAARPPRSGPRPGPA